MIRPGMIISERYEIIEKVGSGGMADVYKAKCHRLNRYVAIKVLKSEFSADKKFVSKFRGEAQSAAGLSHPNIVSVYDVGEDEGLYYIVMELIEGITLKSFIEQKGRLDVREAIGIGIQIAMGMEAAHNNHIIHRDIKPQNIIISREGKVKVTDFGIAKAASSNTITSNAMGSVHYISPEQARGGYSDERSDIYSFGITMYEMLSGKVPFTGDNTVSVALLHIQGEAVPLSEIVRNVPLSVERIVQKCMMKKPERRYQSASELIADLKRSISNPNGNFVRIAPDVVTDSPTKEITGEEVGHIKSAAKTVRPNYEQEPVDTGNLFEEEQEEQEGRDVDPKLEKMMIIGGVAAAVILAIVIIVLIVKLVSGGGASKGEEAEVSSSPEPIQTEEIKEEETEEEVPVPDVLGMSFEDAREVLEEAGFEVRYTEKESDEYEEGQIIAQKPDALENAKEGSVVKLIISLGTSQITIPSVSGMSKAEAAGKLEAAGFENIQHEYEFSDSVEENKVLRVVPSEGTKAAKQDAITIYVSKGKEIVYCEIPNLVTLTESQAAAKLEAEGLTKGQVVYEESDTVEKGCVIRQDYTAGSKVEKGTAVSITVSSGKKEPEPTPTPTATPEPVSHYYGSANISYVPFDSEEESGTVRIVLVQDGVTKTVFEKECTIYDFPMPISVESESGSDGTLQMYVDGSAVGESISVSFTKGQ